MERRRGDRNESVVRVRCPPARDPRGPVSGARPRAAFDPPGDRDFFTVARLVAPGPCLLRGRAWSAWGRIRRVDVSTDGGRTWQAARLDPPAAGRAARTWLVRWEAVAGEHRLCCRAVSADGAGRRSGPGGARGAERVGPVEVLSVRVVEHRAPRSSPG